jgi:hypothetical protein
LGCNIGTTKVTKLLELRKQEHGIKKQVKGF